MRKKYKYVKTDLVCLDCGNVFTIQRHILSQRTVGHIKDLYCPMCKDYTNYYEVRDVNAFKWEYSFIDKELIDNDTKKVLGFLNQKEVNGNAGENRVFKKVLTRK